MYNTLHPVHTIQPSCAHIRYQFRYTLRVCVSLRLFHEKPCHGNTRARSKIPRGFVSFIQLDKATRPHQVLCAFGVIIVLVGVLRELSLKLPDLLLQSDNV